MATNLNNKTKVEIIYELLLSLNKGNSCDYSNRVHMAVLQYDELVERGLINE